MKEFLNKWCSKSRVQGKIEFLLSYARLGFGIQDKIKLLVLAWNRFKVYSNSTLKRKNCEIRLRKLHGSSVVFGTNEIAHLAIFDEIFVEGIYDDELKKVPFVPDLIIDCGAHVAFFSALAHVRWPEVAIVAFEPDLQNAAFARQVFRQNQIRGVVFESAVGNAVGHHSFDRGEGMGRLCSSGDVMVPVVNLPVFLSAWPSRRCLLKMDIEGAEMTLLPHVLQALPPVSAILVELHSSEAECARIRETCAAAGFTVHKVRERCAPSGDLRFVDLFLLRNPCSSPEEVSGEHC